LKEPFRGLIDFVEKGEGEVETIIADF